MKTCKTTHQEIENVLKEIVRGTYEINQDGFVDVEGDVQIPERYTNIPVQFGYVSGNFICSYTKITSLKGAPREVGGYFDCGGTKITSLKGAPREVGGYFDCESTNITSLKGAPIEVGGSFYCFTTNITSLEGSPREVGRSFYCSYTKLTSLKGAPREIHEDLWCKGIFKTEPDHSFINIGNWVHWKN